MATAAAAAPTVYNAGENFQDRSKGKDVRNSNIIAAKAVANAIRTSLGPRGMDKLVQMPDGQTLISNDGATLLSKMKVLHPAAKMLVELSQSQDIQAGDGTTTVVVLAGALLEACAALLEKGIHPTQIATSFLAAANQACEFLQEASRPVDLANRQALFHAVETCLSSKVVSQHSDLLAPIAIDSVLGLVPKEDLLAKQEKSDGNGRRQTVSVDLRDVRLVEQVGGTVDDTELVHGLVLTKGASRSSGGPSSIQDAKVGLIQYCLSAPKTDMDNSVVVSDYAAMDRILKQERKYILQQCKAIKQSGCNVLLIQKSILRDAYNELSLHFLAKMNILVVTDIERPDVDFICQTLGCQPIAHQDQIAPDKLGCADSVTDVFMEGGSNKVVKFTGVHHGDSASRPVHRPTMTVLLRGSNEYVLSEAARSLHDAQCVVRSLIYERYLIAGGGAPETEASLRLRSHALALTGKDAYCFAAFADALEVVPYTLAENAGMKPIEVVTELRAKHKAGEKGAGINVKKGCVSDMYELNVVQPLLVSTSAIRLATETVAMIMKIDDIIVVG